MNSSELLTLFIGLVASISLSLLFMWKLGVFSSAAFFRAPQRPNTLSFIQPLIVLVAYFFSAIAVMLILAVVGYHFPPLGAKASTSQIPDSPDLILDGGARLIALAVMLYIAGQTFTNGINGIGISWRKLPSGLGIGLISFLLLMPQIYFLELASAAVNLMLTNAPPPEHPLLQQLQNNPSNLEMLLLVLTACVVAPITEEFFFRGIIQSWLSRVFSKMRQKRALQPASQINWPGINAAPASTESASPEAIQPLDRWLAIIITAALFACAHLTVEGVASLAPLFVLAVGLGYIYER